MVSSVTTKDVAVGPPDRSATQDGSFPLSVSKEGGDLSEKAEQEKFSAAVKPPRDIEGLSWILVVISILAPFFLFALDNTVVADVQPKVVDSLGDIEKLPWVSVAFALGAVSVNLIWGKIYGQLNVKYLFLCSVFIFEVGSAVCGAAPTMDTLIIGRAICGLGGSGIYLGCMNILSALTTEVERPAYLSLIGLMWGLGTVLGPIIGGAFTDSSATWRWAFYINLCVGGAIAPVLLFLLPSNDPRPGVKIRTRINEIDGVGAILIIGSFVSGIMAISFGGAIFAWRSPQIIGLFACSGVLWILFGFQQALCLFTTPVRRLFPVEMLRSYEMCILFALTATSITSCFLPIYFIPLYFQYALDESALTAAVRLLPFVFILVSAVIFNGVAMGKTGYYMPWYLCGGILVTLGGALMFTINLDSGAGQVYGYSVLVAIGTGFYSQASFPVAQAKVRPERIPAAVAFIGCGQIGGMAIALSVSNAIFINGATDKISVILPNADKASLQQAISGAGGSVLQSLSESQRTEVLAAIVSSIQNVYIMVIAAGALTIVLSVFMKRERLFLGP